MVETALAGFLCCPICSSFMAVLAIEPKTKLKAQSIKEFMKKSFDMLMGVTSFEKMDYTITIDVAEI
ncbi:unnamed protein product [Auanema sp. JU1783]|nr:unnamed protein product [Auanema sp. JU1783]